jgi:hypothetical protein
MEVLKVQTTLRGYYAWVVQRLTERNREPQADTAAHLLRLWIEQNADSLAKIGLSNDAFLNDLDKRDKVKDFNRGARESG